MLKRIAVVGNAPTEKDLCSHIDGADRVVRFNNAFGYGGVTGTRIDDLHLVNCGGQPLEWLRSDTFWTRDYLVRTTQITLPLAAPDRRRRLSSADDGRCQSTDGLNFEWDLRDALKRLGKTVRTLPTETVDAAVEVLRGLGGDGKQITPSTGYLAVYDYLEQCGRDTVIDLYGFSFAGWCGHSWACEKAWVLQQQKTGRLCWHAL